MILNSQLKGWRAKETRSWSVSNTSTSSSTRTAFERQPSATLQSFENMLIWSYIPSCVTNFGFNKVSMSTRAVQSLTISKLNNNQKRNWDWVIHILSSSTLYLLQIHQSTKQLPFVCSQKLMIDHDKDVCNWCNNFLVKFYTFLKLYIVTCFLPCAYYIWLMIFWTFSTLRFSSPPFQGSEPLLALQLVLPERLIVIKVMMTTNSLIQEWQQWVWVYFMDDNSDNHKVWVCVCYRVSCLSCLRAGKKTDDDSHS